MSKKIVIIGGGSKLWAPGFVTQFIRSDKLGLLEIVLHDIDGAALDLLYQVSLKLNAGGSNVKISQSTVLEDALTGADFVLVSISTGGLKTMKFDLEIPEKYEIYHTVGDTVGPGGYLRAVRNIPVFRNFAEKMKSVCPAAWMINVSNPLSVLTRTPDKTFGIKTIGMCPGAHNHAGRLARVAGFGENAIIDYTVTGIDHGSWFTHLSADGEDVIARLKELGFYRSDGILPVDEIKTDDPMVAEAAISRAVFAIWRETGYMPAINDRHFVENFPNFLCGGRELPFRLKRTYIAERQKYYDDRKILLDRFLSDDDDAILNSPGHGNDPILDVIEALSGKSTFTYACNYANIGQIPGLPERAVVETRCIIDAGGVHPLVSPMPSLIKAMVMPHVLRQEAVIDIALDGTFDELVALIMTDPLCSRLPVGKCREMVKEMLEGTAGYISNPELLNFS